MAHKETELILEISLKLKDASMYLDLLYKVRSLQIKWVFAIASVLNYIYVENISLR